MAAQEMYDYLSAKTMTATYNYDISLAAQGVVTERSMKNQVIHIGDDGSEERVGLSDDSIFYVEFNWNVLSESDAGTVMDWYNDPNKANGKLKSFKWTHGDGHTYVVRFDCDLSRVGQSKSRYSIPNIRFKILGIPA